MFTIGPAMLLIIAGQYVGHTLLTHGSGALFLLIALVSVFAFLGLFLAGLFIWASSIIDAYQSAVALGRGRPRAGGATQDVPAVSSDGRKSLLGRLRRRQRSAATGEVLPDPSIPPGNRGSWDRAALINTDITELVKRQINTKTKIWQR